MRRIKTGSERYWVLTGSLLVNCLGQRQRSRCRAQKRSPRRFLRVSRPGKAVVRVPGRVRKEGLAAGGSQGGGAACMVSIPLTPLPRPRTKQCPAPKPPCRGVPGAPAQRVFAGGPCLLHDVLVRVASSRGWTTYVVILLIARLPGVIVGKSVGSSGSHLPLQDSSHETKVCGS